MKLKYKVPHNHYKSEYAVTYSINRNNNLHYLFLYPCLPYGFKKRRLFGLFPNRYGFENILSGIKIKIQ